MAFLRPILSTMSWLIIDPNMWPMGTIATRVETLESVTEIGESGAINFTIFGEVQPTIAPMHKLIIEPRFRIITPRNRNVTWLVEREIATAVIISGNNRELSSKRRLFRGKIKTEIALTIKNGQILPCPRTLRRRVFALLGDHLDGII